MTDIYDESAWLRKDAPMEPQRPKRRPRRNLTKEYKQQVVDLIRSSGKTPGEVAEELDLTRTAVAEWVKQADIDDGAKPGVTTAEAERVKALEQEVRELRRANAILKSASAFFAAELDRPSK